ncbi:MAG: HD domain-containing protein [Phycisphaeraceae bacterium]|nr:HD domain-containing protein [Phycisphaeraceae bacterium]
MKDLRSRSEVERLSALRSYDLLNSCAIRGFDELVNLASYLYDVPIAFVSLLDDKQQWFKSKCGLDMNQAAREFSFCKHTILEPCVMVVPDARKDERFANNPMVTGPMNVRFYAGTPLINPDGYALGTFSVIDEKPRQMSTKEIALLDSIGRQVMDQIQLHQQANQARDYYERVMKQSGILEDEVRKRTEDVIRTREEVVHCLARAAEFRDDDTGTHVIRVSKYVGLMAKQLGLTQAECELMELAATLHDIGKIGVPDSVLLKPGKLTEAEFNLMRGHAGIGGEILSALADTEHTLQDRHCEVASSIIGKAEYPLLQLAEEIAQSHHEKFDGSGYPRGLVGDQIPLSGRITAVADVFDALGTERPYKKAFPQEECMAILEEGRGSHFDPDVLDAFNACLDQILVIKETLHDQPDEAGLDEAA